MNYSSSDTPCVGNEVKAVIVEKHRLEMCVTIKIYTQLVLSDLIKINQIHNGEEMGSAVKHSKAQFQHLFF